MLIHLPSLGRDSKNYLERQNAVGGNSERDACKPRSLWWPTRLTTATSFGVTIENMPIISLGRRYIAGIEYAQSRNHLK
jgi:hypothetical protein